MPAWPSIPHIAASSAVHGVVGLGIESILHPWRTEIAARYQWSDLATRYKAWVKQPFVLPEPGDLLDALARFRPDQTGGWLQWALLRHGIVLTDDYTPPGMNTVDTSSESFLWDMVIEARRTVPGPGVWAEMFQRGWPLGGDVDDLIRRAGGSPSHWKGAARIALSRPSPEVWFEAYTRGLLGSPTDPDGNGAMRRQVARAGGDVADYLNAYGIYRQYPSVAEAMEGVRRGKVDPVLWAKVLKFHRVDSDELQPLWQELQRSIPGARDLVSFVSRQLFAPELAVPYGLYDGFDERSRPWFAKLGLDYPLGFNITVDGQQREATLPDLYWAASREILPLGSAYLAYQRLRPGHTARYQMEAPNIRPFTVEDLRAHMRIAGYPPPIQDFLIALSHPPIGLRQIRASIQFGGWDIQRTKDAFLDLGYSQDDSLAQAETLIAQNEARDTQWMQALATNAKKETVKQIEGMYDDGILTRQQAMQHLSATGLPQNLSTQLLDLSDSQRARGLLRSSIAATGRDYLSGALSAEETSAALAAYGITPARAGELMQIWTIRRSRHRRQADTSKIIKWVGTGRISSAEGARRLSNLGWSNPDALLLLAEAQDNLAKLHAREEKLAQADDARKARELERLAREAQAEAKRLVAEANRLAPRGVLTKWLLDKVITESEWRQAMKDRGYTDNLIEDYYRDATTPRAPRPKVAPPVRPFPRPAGSAHPGLAVAAKWLKDGIIDTSKFEDMLRDIGYGQSDIERFVLDASGGQSAKAAPKTGG